MKEERFEDAAAFLENDLVAEYVERAADNTTYSEDHFWDALTVIAREGECTSGDIAPLVEIAKKSVSGVLSSLESNKVLVSESKGQSKAYALNIDGIDDILDLKERREKIRQKSQQLKNANDEGDTQ